MTTEEKIEITKISQEFAAPFRAIISPINGSGWLIVDPLSCFLNAAGFPHTLSQLAPTNAHPQVLILEFPDGSLFIPAGGDLRKIHKACTNWMWCMPNPHARRSR